MACNDDADVLARLPPDLPAHLRREVEQALKRHRVEEAASGRTTAVAETTSLTVSAVKTAALEQVRTVDMNVAAQRLRAMVELRLGVSSMPRNPTPEVLQCHCTIRETMPCVAFRGTSLVVVDSVVDLIIKGAGPSPVLRLGLTTVHFATDGSEGPGLMHTQSCIMTSAEWLGDRNAAVATAPRIHRVGGTSITQEWHAQLDCYARPMLHMGLVQLLLHHNGRSRLLSVAERLLSESKMDKASVMGLRRRAVDGAAPPLTSSAALSFPTGPWVVLGLGGGCISCFLAASLPPSVTVTSIEIEPTVALINRLHLGYPCRPNMPLIVDDATNVIKDASRFPRASQRGVVLDCFDPAVMTMLCATELLRSCWSVVAEGGVLLVNAHVSPGSPGAMDPFVEVCGGNAVLHVMVIQAYEQCLVVCVKGATEANQALSLWEYRAAATVFSNEHAPLLLAESTDPVTRLGADAALSGVDSAFRGGWLDGGCFSSSKHATIPKHDGVMCRQWICGVAPATTASPTLSPPSDNGETKKRKTPASA